MASALPRVSRPRPTYCVFFGYIVALHASLLWIFHNPVPKRLVGDEFTYLTAARGLLDTGVLELDPLWPPMYAYFLSGLLWLGGNSILFVQAVQISLLVVCALCLRGIGTRLFDSPRAGTIAGAIALGYPPLVAFAGYLWPEVLHLTLFLLALRILVGNTTPMAWLAVAGCLLGVALLTKLILWPFVPLIALPLIVRHRWAGAGHSAIVFVAVAITVVTLTPPTRPGAQPASFGANVAYNTWLGLNDTSRRTFVDSIAGDEYRRYLDSGTTTAEREAVLQANIRSHVEEQGFFRVFWRQLGRQYFRLFDHSSYFTAQLPGGEVAATGVGYRDTAPWAVAVLRTLSSALYAAMLSMTVIGLLAYPWRRAAFGRASWLAVLVGFIGYNLGILLVLHVVSRYRVQMLPTFFLFAAYAVTSWLEAREAGSSGLARLLGENAASRRLRAAAVALMLFLAFAGPILDSWKL